MSDFSQIKFLDKLGCGEECGRGLTGGGLDDLGYFWEVQVQRRVVSLGIFLDIRLFVSLGFFYLGFGLWIICIFIFWEFDGNIDFSVYLELL